MGTKRRLVVAVLVVVLAGLSATAAAQDRAKTKEIVVGP